MAQPGSLEPVALKDLQDTTDSRTNAPGSAASPRNVSPSPKNSKTNKSNKPKRSPRNSPRPKIPQAQPSSTLTAEAEPLESSDVGNSEDQRRRKAGTPGRKGRGGKKNQSQDISRNTSANSLPTERAVSSPNVRHVSDKAPPSLPQNIVPTQSNQAYAGPTFHASPAASSLPMPRFMSKSVPPTADPAAPTEGKENATQPMAAPTGPLKNFSTPTREESPLDVLFNAQRAEQARRASQQLSPFPQQMRPATEGRPVGDHLNRHHLRSHSARTDTPQGRRPVSAQKQQFLMELDGQGADQSAETFKSELSFQQRLAALREASPQPYGPGPTPSEDEKRRQEQTRALKGLLNLHESAPGTGASVHKSGFGQSDLDGFAASIGAGASARPVSARQPQQLAPRDTVSTGQGRPSSATTAETAGSRTPDVKAMENDLRRILKMDS